MKYEAIRENSNRFTVGMMCKVLDVRRSNYYRWLRNRMKRKEVADRENREIEVIEEIHRESDEIYGYRAIAREMKERGMEISEYRVRRLMRENGIYAKIAIRKKPYGKSSTDGRYHDNKVKQKFNPDRKNRIWAGDITYIRTNVGWVYLSVVMDLYNREIIGYDVSRKIDTELAMRALGNAIGRRGRDDGLIFHSDRGSQYASKGYHQMLERNGIEGSMSRGGCPYDNSCVESFFASLKKEKIYRKKYDTIEDVKKDMFWYIEIFYNRKRRHSSLGYKTPVEYRMMNA
jgi:transposase InsO family protein